MKIKTLQLGKYKLKWRNEEVVHKTTATRTKPKHTDVSLFLFFLDEASSAGMRRQLPVLLSVGVQTINVIHTSFAICVTDIHDS